MNGWYYDKQLENRLMSVSLHPNKRPTPKEENNELYNWGDFTDDESDDEYYVDGDGTIKTGHGYSKRPIARAIISDDFNVSIANQWTPVGGDGGISALWNQVRGIQPFLPVINSTFEEISETTSKKEEEAKEKGHKVTAGISHIGKVISTYLHSLGDHIQQSGRLNDSLVIQNTRFSYYAGTGTAFSNLGLKYTIFPYYGVNPLNPKNKEPHYLSVTEQVAMLLPYCNGTFEEDNLEILLETIKAWFLTDNDGAKIVGKDVAKAKENFNTEFNKLKNDWRKGGDVNDWKTGLKQTAVKATDGIQDVYKKIAEKVNAGVKKLVKTEQEISAATIKEINEKFAGLISWQHAPGGYIPSFKDIDKPIEGTLKLMYGTQYSISSLLVADATFNFSKTMVKAYDSQKNLILDPLYCDVTLTLTPATKFSNRALNRFVGLKRFGDVDTSSSPTMTNWSKETGWEGHVPSVVESMEYNLNGLKEQLCNRYVQEEK